MAKYEKWLGAGLGWMVTGNPLGGLIGFLAGNLIGSDSKKDTQNILAGVSEFETNLIVLASHLIKIDGKIELNEISFTRNFLDAHFDATHSDKRTQVLNHCLQKEYDLNVVCDQLRMYASQNTRVQIVRFLFDLAMSDSELNERENYFIFKIAGYLNVNDVDFRRIKKEHLEPFISDYDLLGVNKDSSMVVITNAYRQLVLRYHPDRHSSATAEEKKALALKFQQVKEAYQKIKRERG